jgi:hypothetical protein
MLILTSFQVLQALNLNFKIMAVSALTFFYDSKPDMLRNSTLYLIFSPSRTQAGNVSEEIINMARTFIFLLDCTIISEDMKLVS